MRMVVAVIENALSFYALDIFAQWSTMVSVMLQCSMFCSRNGGQPIMSPTARVHHDTITEDVSEKTEIQDHFAAIFLHGMERIAEIQKQAVDIAVQHNTEIVDILKKAAEKMPGTPRLP